LLISTGLTMGFLVSGKIMDNIDLYGKHTKEIPGLNTVKTLEKRKYYILQKLKVRIEEKSFLLKELRALEKVINFITWMQNNLSNHIVREIIEQYEMENKENGDE